MLIIVNYSLNHLHFTFENINFARNSNTNNHETTETPLRTAVVPNLLLCGGNATTKNIGIKAIG